MPSFRYIALLFLTSILPGSAARAQISLSTAVDLALRNSPKLRMAQADYAKAHAAVGEARDAYVPSVAATGGVGKSTGAPLSVPVVFSLSAQSLVFARSQSDYIRAARLGLDSTQHALNEARIEVVEDTTATYVGLGNAFLRRDVLKQEGEIAHRLVEVTSARTDAGVDARIELTKSRRTEVQIRLLSLNLEDEIAGLKLHLANLTGLQVGGLTIDASSIPQFGKPQAAQQGSNAAAITEGITAAFAIAKSKEYSAEGDRRSLFWPQIAFVANYSRVNTAFSSYLDYYPRFAGSPGNPNSENALGIGLQITLPLFDLVHRAKAHQSAADAARALAEAQSQRDAFLDGRAKLHNSAMELDARSELASYDRDIAQNQLETIQLQLQVNAAANSSGIPLNPKDELNARLQERSKYYDMLSANLQLQQAQVNLLRQDGGLADWIHASIGSPVNAPVGPIGIPETNTPRVPGTAPSAPSTSPTGAADPAAKRAFKSTYTAVASRAETWFALLASCGSRAP